jgi:hypothetical protein
LNICKIIKTTRTHGLNTFLIFGIQ